MSSQRMLAATRTDRHGTERSTRKCIFVTGGVVSSLGKGLAAASIGALLEGHGCKVTLQNSTRTSTSTRAP